MKLVITKKTVDGKINLVESADGRFKWNSWSDGYLIDTKLNESIYQMRYSNKESMGSREIMDEKEIELIRDFWNSLEILKKEVKDELWEKELEAVRNSKETPRKDGLCLKCNTYCCGDCESDN